MKYILARHALVNMLQIKKNITFSLRKECCRRKMYFFLVNYNKLQQPERNEVKLFAVGFKYHLLFCVLW